MKWNDGQERAKFEKEHEKLRKEYLAAGMTEKQIQDIFEYDWAEYRRTRIEAIHTQDLDFDSAEFDDKETDNPLYKKFLSAISVTVDYSDSSRFGWVEGIDNERIVNALRTLPKDYLELLTDIIIDGLTQSEIAKKRGVKKAAINNKMSRIRKIFKIFM